MLVLLLGLVLENSGYLALGVMEQNNCRRIGLSFRRRSPGVSPKLWTGVKYEHDDEHEHDSPNFGIWVKPGRSVFPICPR